MTKWRQHGVVRGDLGCVQRAWARCGAVSAVLLLLAGVGPDWTGSGVRAAEAPVTKLTAIVETVKEDSTLAGSLPAFYSRDTLTRELAMALEATGDFSVPTRDAAEIKPLVAELRRTGGHSIRTARVRFVLEPVVASITLDERQRQAPHMRAQVLASIQGSVSMFVTVLDTRDGTVTRRIPIDVRYASAEQLIDGDPDRVISDGARAVHVSTNSAAYVQLCKAVGRAFAKRILDQVSPAFVAQRSGERVYLTRGQDAGYHIGEQLRIIHRGGPIYHPVTHEQIGFDEQEAGMVEVTEIMPKLSIAKIVQSNGTIASGDVAREQVDGDTN